MARRRNQGRDRSSELRIRLAQEAARLIAEQGISDRRQALRKAMQRLGVDDKAALPQPDELEQALLLHQRLFGSAEQPDALRKRRQAALEAMDFLAGFEPRLVGAVLDGTADQHAAVQLHLFSDDADAVGRFLIEHAIPHQVSAQNLRTQPGRAESYPVYAFIADQIDFELTVLPHDSLRQAPVGSGERPMQRANRTMLRELLASEDDGSGGA